MTSHDVFENRLSSFHKVAPEAGGVQGSAGGGVSVASAVAS